MTLRIGIDFGGTKIEAAVLDEGGDVLHRQRTDTPRDYDTALATLRELVGAVETRLGRSARIGIGTPGSLVRATGLMRNANSVYLNGRPFLRDLETALAREVRLANDANCFALSEAIDGAAAGHHSVFGLIVGTGCGGGVVIGRTLVDGAHGLGGELGHMPLPDPGADELPAPKCWCGLSGCFESWVSGTGFRRAFAAATGRELDPPAIVEAAVNGDPEAMVALERYRDRLARGLSVVANLLDPDAIVLGGGMSNVAPIYEGLAEAIRLRTFSGAWTGSVVQARWGDSSGVRGAALLWDVGEA
ncbi:ROK family protein [Novosphingobium sp. KA1]|uniref:ROK family protein n=1 Tax=Novosphingobium sp. (strain KA1) TaxID=164608 RepID=UPI001A8FF408|nr:ROK family protein [Novosphingobium sp. KA1]QSR17207.1 fructokinase [Novosphingobium sp. KA1]